MATILDKINDQIRIDEKTNFENFDKASFTLKERKVPIDIISKMDEGFFVIAEAKKGSPSKGIIREDFDPVEIAVSYEKFGASAVSVITEKNFFFGGKENLAKVRKEVSIPLLRKDFIIHPYQVFEAYNLGADMVLLIAASLTDEEMASLKADIESLGMTALIEVHNEEELKRVLSMDPKLIGINNRNLKTFDVDFETSFELKKMIPEHVKVISESGISGNDEIKRLRSEGFAGALIGESLLRQEDTGNALRELIK